MKLNRFIASTATTLRSLLMRRSLDPRRDIWDECGYPEVITIQDYKNEFQRGDIAARVISLLPEDSWSQKPDVYETEDPDETEFEKAWEDLDKRKHIVAQMQRADVLSGIGRFGGLLLGLDDGGALETPVPGIEEDGSATKSTPQKRELLYLRAFDETALRVETYQTNMANPRFGQPLFYSIQFTDTSLAGAKAATSARVHWSRIIHIADNRTDSEIYGAPRLEKVFNRLLDIQKIVGGSGEMFWRGGFPGLSIETPAGTPEDVEIDEAATKEQMEAYMNGLQRYIATLGLTVKSLAPQIADPKTHIESQIRMIAIAYGIPWRILMGAEVGQLASEQDVKNWNRRLTRRREDYITPFIIAPMVERLISVGVLPTPSEYFISWPDLDSPSDSDIATVAERRTNALSKYATSGADVLVSPYHFLTKILGLEEDAAVSIIKDSGEPIFDEDNDEDNDRSTPPSA